MRAMSQVLSANTNSGKLNGGFIRCGRKRGGTENRGAESPAKTLSGTFGAGSFCDACQHMDLTNINFPYFFKQILSRESFLQMLPRFIYDSPIITLPSLTLSSHHCSLSSLVPSLGFYFFFSQSQFPCLYLLVIILVSALQTWLSIQYFLRATFFPHFYF